MGHEVLSKVSVPSRIILGVGGGIAAYKACEVLRGLVEAGHEVHVIPTSAALKFVGTATFEALSGNPVQTGVFTDVSQVRHVRLGKEADLVIVLPATADLLARAAHGRADDLLTATLLMARCPVAFFPAMHTEMWTHPATQDNVATLRGRGMLVPEPASGRLTGADSGPGRLADPASIIDLAQLLLANQTALPHDLSGLTVVVSAGGTREPIDPVRFIGNRSSGRQGFAVATVAAARGANVTLIAAHTAELSTPAGVTIKHVGTAQELATAMRKEAAAADVVVMAAAVADFRPVNQEHHKIKKIAGQTHWTINLTQTEDILLELSRNRNSAATIVGFAAETGDEAGSVLDHARAKLVRKGCDLLVVNSVEEGKGFESTSNSGWLLTRAGAEKTIPLGSKMQLATALWDEVVSWRGGHG